MHWQTVLISLATFGVIYGIAAFERARRKRERNRDASR